MFVGGGQQFHRVTQFDVFGFGREIFPVPHISKRFTGFVETFLQG